MRLAVVACALLAVAATQRGGCGEPPAPPAPVSDACEGLACGAECAIEPACRRATPPCAAPTVLGRCDAAGACVLADVTCGPSPCAGKKCGEACSLCPPDATDCLSILCLTSCDGTGRCTCTGGGAACP